MTRSAFLAADDKREYNVYIETAKVERHWPSAPDEPLTWQLGPLLVSLEILLKILDDSLERDGERNYLLHRRKAEVIVRSICSLLHVTADLLRDMGSAGNPIVCTAPRGAKSKASAWFPARAKLERLQGGAILCERMRAAYDLVAQGLGIDPGLGEKCAGDQSAERLDYDRWVRPEAAHALYAPDRRARYVEDATFVRVHQACEGILEAMLVELNRVESALFSRDYQQAESSLLTAARFMEPFQDAVRILAEMNQFDYAPLRVALRDASGIQSSRAQNRKTVARDQFWFFENHLKSRKLDCLVVMAFPARYPDEHRVLRAFDALGRAISETMSVHAHIVESILGADVLGTLGFRVLTLGEVAARPLFPVLAASLDRLTLWTSLKFASHSGRVIEQRERAHGVGGKYQCRLPEAPCAEALMRSGVDNYFAAIRTQNKGEWTATFSDNPHFEDPKGTKPYISEQKLDIFFRNFVKLFPELYDVAYTVEEAGGNHLRVRWRMVAESFLNVGQVEFTGVETFHFQADGKIAAAFAEWDSAKVADEIMERHRAAISLKL